MKDLIRQNSFGLKECPYTSLKDAPGSWKKLNGVALTLLQVNWVPLIGLTTINRHANWI